MKKKEWQKYFSKDTVKEIENHPYTKQKIFDKNDDNIYGEALYHQVGENTHRYCLYINLGNGQPEKTLTTIMLNPSNTSPQEGFDKTVCNIIEIAKTLKYSHVVILNLFSYINPNSQDIGKKGFFKQEDKHYKLNEINNNFLTKYLQNQNADILVAWGFRFKNNTKHKHVKNIIDVLKSKSNIYSFCENSNSKKYPKHPGRIYKIEKYISKLKGKLIQYHFYE